MKMSRYQSVTLIVISISTAMLFLDMTIFSVALPAIQKSFNATRAQTQWIVNIYLLVASVLAFAAGRISDMFGHQKVFSIGILIFLLASLMCGISFNVVMLIFFRAIQAFGAAFTLIAGMSLSASIFSDADRGKANGIVMSVGSLAMVLSPFIGGIIVQWLNWHWIFFINVILGIFIFYPTLKLLREKSERRVGETFDYIGFLIIGLFTIVTTLTFNNAGQWGWSSLKSISGFLISLMSFILFIFIEKNKKHPVIRIQLFKIVNYVPGCAIMAMAQVTNYFIIFFGVFLQNALGFSSFISGCLLLPAGILLAVFSSVGGYFSDKYGARMPMIAGLLLLTVGYSASTLFLKTLSYYAILPALVGYGIGGCFLSNPLRTSILRNTPKEFFGMSSAILSGVRQVGGVIGFAITAGIIVHVERIKAQAQLLQLVPSLTTQKIHTLLGILSNTPSSQAIILQFSPSTQETIKNVIVKSYEYSLYCALFFTSVLLLLCLLIALFFIKSENSSKNTAAR
ncbi:MAG: hypothetical protein A3E82_08295 [Gammaproteobacteria bacterium RIFCSPHIGHO2_12_FULL_38_11]|nr:MAG: hypothetical protein A3E82_08295 [Gammaproteobacteria bacterium RIFCSPHIGHO2_12_FULL_38_11]